MSLMQSSLDAVDGSLDASAQIKKSACPSQDFKDHVPYQAVLRCSEEGCKHCKLLCDVLQGQGSLVFNLNAEDTVLKLQHGYLTVTQTSQQKVNNIQIFVPKRDSGSEQSFDFPAVVQRTLVTAPGSAESYKVIQNWINTCDSLHKLCNGSRVANPVLPKRVLKISQSGIEGAECTVKLLESSGIRGSYIALSYCWGDSLTVKTTKDTLEAYQKGIDFHSLPKTIRHAIIITNGLDVEYLWVDCLCIVQDDADDWAVESANIGEIYENAWLTVAAATAFDVSQGLFNPRAKPREIMWADTDGNPTTVYVNELGSKGHAREWLRSFYNDLALFQRGWTLQERLASTRIVYMCNEEMIWECNTNVKCECSGLETSSSSDIRDYDTDASSSKEEGEKPDGLKSEYRRRLQLWPAIREISSRIHDLGNGLFWAPDYSQEIPIQQDGLWEHWDRILHVYTRRKLTRHTDRLPALSSIAKNFEATRVLGKYVAGLWTAKLLPSLLWYMTPHVGIDPQPRTPRNYGAPSWSWASVNGSWCYVRLPFETTPMARLTDQQIWPSNVKNVYGNVEVGIITLRSPVVRAMIDFTPSDPRQNYQTQMQQQKVSLKPVDIESNPEIADSVITMTYMDFVLDRDGPTAKVLPRDKVFLVPIQEFELGGERYRGLILRKLNSDREVYERIRDRLASYGPFKEWWLGYAFERIGMFAGPKSWFCDCLPMLVLIM